MVVLKIFRPYTNYKNGPPKNIHLILILVIILKIPLYFKKIKNEKLKFQPSIFDNTNLDFKLFDLLFPLD